MIFKKIVLVKYCQSFCTLHRQLVLRDRYFGEFFTFEKVWLSFLAAFLEATAAGIL